MKAIAWKSIVLRILLLSTLYFVGMWLFTLSRVQEGFDLFEYALRAVFFAAFFVAFEQWWRHRAQKALEKTPSTKLIENPERELFCSWLHEGKPIGGKMQLLDGSLTFEPHKSEKRSGKLLISFTDVVSIYELNLLGGAGNGIGLCLQNGARHQFILRESSIWKARLEYWLPQKA